MNVTVPNGLNAILFNRDLRPNVVLGVDRRTDITRTSLDPDVPSSKWFNSGRVHVAGDELLRKRSGLLQRSAQPASICREPRDCETDRVRRKGGCRAAGGHQQPIQPNAVRKHQHQFGSDERLRPPYGCHDRPAHRATGASYQLLKDHSSPGAPPLIRPDGKWLRPEGVLLHPIHTRLRFWPPLPCLFCPRVLSGLD
jgi:hypothetical protein